MLTQRTIRIHVDESPIGPDYSLHLYVNDKLTTIYTSGVICRAVGCQIGGGMHDEKNPQIHYKDISQLYDALLIQWSQLIEAVDKIPYYNK